MCTLSEPAAPSSPAQALAMVSAGLGYLAACDAAGLGTAVQAEALVGLEQAEARHTAARASARFLEHTRVGKKLPERNGIGRYDPPRRAGVRMITLNFTFPS